jgi:undecaprenyl-diphosphatase
MITKEKAKYIKKEFLHDIGSLGSFPVHIFLLIILFIIPTTYEIGLLNLIGFVLTIIIAYLVRIFYFKHRPNKRTYQTLLEKIDASSFPSIHTARSFSFAVITGAQTNNYLLTALLAIAVIIGYSRITLEYHHKSDVIAGAVLGIMLATLILFLF